MPVSTGKIPYGFHIDELGFLAAVDREATRLYKTFVGKDGNYREVVPKGIKPIAWRFPPYYLRDVYFEFNRGEENPDILGIYVTKNGVDEVFSGFRYRHENQQHNGRSKEPVIEVLTKRGVKKFI